MMELKGGGMARIAAEYAFPAGLPYKELLDFSPASRHRFCAALRAAQASLRLDRHVSNQSVRTTLDHDIGLPRPSHGIQSHPALATLCLEPMLSQPVTDRSVTNTQSPGDTFDRQPLTHQGLKLVACHTAFRAVPSSSACLQPVLLQPIADRRRMPADQFADRVEREVLCQTVFEEALFHAKIIALASDRKFRSIVTR